jgi:hypothetical protein
MLHTAAPLMGMASSLVVLVVCEQMWQMRVHMLHTAAPLMGIASSLVLIIGAAYRSTFDGNGLIIGGPSGV